MHPCLSLTVSVAWEGRPGMWGSTPRNALTFSCSTRRPHSPCPPCTMHTTRDTIKKSTQRAPKRTHLPSHTTTPHLWIHAGCTKMLWEFVGLSAQNIRREARHAFESWHHSPEKLRYAHPTVVLVCFVNTASVVRNPSQRPTPHAQNEQKTCTHKVRWTWWMGIPFCTCLLSLLRKFMCILLL